MKYAAIRSSWRTISKVYVRNTACECQSLLKQNCAWWGAWLPLIRRTNAALAELATILGRHATLYQQSLLNILVYITCNPSQFLLMHTFKHLAFHLYRWSPSTATPPVAQTASNSTGWRRTWRSAREVRFWCSLGVLFVCRFRLFECGLTVFVQGPIMYVYVHIHPHYVRIITCINTDKWNKQINKHTLYIYTFPSGCVCAYIYIEICIPTYPIYRICTLNPVRFNPTGGCKPETSAQAFSRKRTPWLVAPWLGQSSRSPQEPKPYIMFLCVFIFFMFGAWDIVGHRAVR